MDPKRGKYKERLDRVLVSQGLASSREIAARTVLAGGVLVNGIVIDKPAKLIPSGARIEVEKSPPFVSRSGVKLAAALDVGCSTGGFTDCLLQRGTIRVYAVDVGYGQFDWRLRQDGRVILIERTNIRFLDHTAVPEPINLAVIDVSFISLTLVLPRVVSFLGDTAAVVALVKPQFEVGKGEVGRGGIVKDDAQRRRVTEKVIACAMQHGLGVTGVLDSPLQGRKGNREVLVGLGRGPPTK